MAGVVGQDQAIYTYSSGWVLDTDNRDWLEIPPRPAARAIYAETVTAAGSRMIVFGGQSWAGDDGTTPQRDLGMAPPRPDR